MTQMIKSEERRYIHDCNQCKFLGQYNEYDLYFCDQSGIIPTVIARFGQRGQDYTSGWTSTHPALIEAKRRYLNA